MDFRQLYYYREIVREASISKAAEKLHIAQPPLGQLLKRLEDELETTLIHRYRQKWEVTEAGLLLYDYANQIVGQTDQLKKRIHELEVGQGGTIEIGVSSSCYNLLIDYLQSFRSQYPEVKILIHSGDSESLVDKLKEKEIDIAIVMRPSFTDDYDVKVLDSEPNILITPESWANDLPNEPELKDLVHLPFIMLGAMKDYTFRNDLLKSFARRGIKPNIVMECKDLPILVSLVSHELGISIIPGMNNKSLDTEHLKIYKLPQLNVTVEPVFLKLKNIPLSTAANNFWSLVN